MAYDVQQGLGGIVFHAAIYFIQRLCARATLAIRFPAIAGGAAHEYYSRMCKVSQSNTSSIDVGSILRYAAPDSMQSMCRCGVETMSRRRSTNPTKAISVTLPGKLLEELDERLSYSQSRSRWIAEACEKKLQNYDSESLLVVDASVRQLMASLVHVQRQKTS